MSFNCPSFKEQTTGEESRLGPFSICSALHCIWSCILSHLDKQMKNTYFSIHSIYSWPYHLTVTRELANFCWRHYDMEELSYEYQWVVHHWSQTIFWYKLIPFFTTLTNAWKHGKEVMLSSSHKLCISSLAHSLKAKFHRNAAERLWFCHANTLKACFPLLF